MSHNKCKMIQLKLKSICKRCLTQCESELWSYQVSLVEINSNFYKARLCLVVVVNGGFYIT